MLKKASLFVDKNVTAFLKNHPDKFCYLSVGVLLHASIARFLIAEVTKHGLCDWWSGTGLGLFSNVNQKHELVMQDMAERTQRVESVLKVNTENGLMYLETCFYGKGKDALIKRLKCGLGENVGALTIAFDDEVLNGI